MPDFSLSMYREVLSTLSESGYLLTTVGDYLVHEPEYGDNPVAIIRHDIDRRIHKAEVIACLESYLGLCASYYFRFPALESPDVIRSVANLGHEIGYHYEVMSRARGDPEQARNLFERDLLVMRRIGRVQTVCMHGAPLSAINNMTFWDHYRVDDFGLIGEAFLSVTGVEYFSDTGRTWSPAHKMRDHLNGGIIRRETADIRTTPDLIHYIRSFKPRRLYLVTHPERWSENPGEHILLRGVDSVVNLGKAGISLVRELRR